jgi:hypothetical protein
VPASSQSVPSSSQSVPSSSQIKSQSVPASSQSVPASSQVDSYYFVSLRLTQKQRIFVLEKINEIIKKKVDYEKEIKEIIKNLQSGGGNDDELMNLYDYLYLPNNDPAINEELKNSFKVAFAKIVKNMLNAKPVSVKQDKQDKQATAKPAPVKQAKSAQAKSTQAKPAQAKSTQAKPAQAKPAQAKPAQAKPAQAKPAQAKPK